MGTSSLWEEDKNIFPYHFFFLAAGAAAPWEYFVVLKERTKGV
jgi:hypothetical protein